MPEQTERKRICFIVNPVSGRKKNQDISNLVYDIFDKNQFKIIIQITDSAGHAKIISRNAVENKTDIIVAVGGDGTINEVASEMINSESILGIVPTGSGNGLARHLSIPISTPKALKLIRSGHFMTIDTATINNKPFISIAGVGFDAMVAKMFAKKHKRGFLTYFTIIANTFKKYKPKRYELFIDDRDSLQVKALFISFANSNQFGYNTTIAPNAKLNDGKLDICIVKKPHIFDLPRIANLLYLKRIDQSENVQIIQAGKLTVKRKRNRVVNVDGEPIKLSKELNIMLNPESLNVIIQENVEKK